MTPIAIEEYEHHGRIVCVEAQRKGKHREACLCYRCSLFKPSKREENCAIANAVFKNCVDFAIVTPVWECPDFK